MPAPIDELTVTVSADTGGFRQALDELGKRADSFSAAMTRAFAGAVKAAAAATTAATLPRTMPRTPIPVLPEV